MRPERTRRERTAGTGGPGGRLPRGLALWIRVALLAFPQRLRSAFGAELAETVGLRIRAARERRGRAYAVLWVARELAGLAGAGLRARLGARLGGRLGARLDGGLDAGFGAGPTGRRSAEGTRTMEMLAYTIRHGLRAVIRQRGLSLPAVLTLALGLGATVAIFSVVYSVLLRPLPFLEPARLLLVYETNPERGWDRAQVAGANYVDWQRQTTAFAGLAAYEDWLDEVALMGDGEPVAVNVNKVTGNLFSVLGVEALVGRTLSEATTWRRGEGEEPVAMLAHAFWVSRFGADPGVVGRLVELDGIKRRVAGVMPAGFRYPLPEVDVWLPMAWDPAFLGQVWFRRAHGLRVVGRLAPGATAAEADAELAAIAASLEREYPETNTEMGTGVLPLHEYLVGETRTPLLVLATAVGLVLLVACANVANLLLLGAAARADEAATRLALGASRARMVLQGVVESLVLALAGGALGVVLGLWGVRALIAIRPGVLPRLDGAGLNLPVLLFALAVTVAAALACGLLPAWRASRGRVVPAGTRGGRRMTATATLVVLEVALALPLAVGAGLMASSLARMLAVDPGFVTENTLIGSVRLPMSRFDDSEAITRFYSRLLEEVESVPGVERAALSSRLPFTNQRWSSDFTVEGWPSDRYGVGVRHDEVSPGLFSTMGIPLLSGRPFAEAEAEAVVIVNRALAERYFPGVDPIGLRMTFDRQPEPGSIWRRIVGVVENVRRETLARDELPSVYAPILQDTTRGAFLLVRSASDPTLLQAQIEARLHELDPRLPLSGVTTMAETVAQASARERFLLVLLGVFAAVSLVLATLGIFSVAAYANERRVREIGIRMALGAGRSTVLAGAVRRGLVPVVVGAALGVLGAGALGRGLETLLFGIEPWDPAVLIVTTVLVVGIGALACLVPARRATRVEVATVLRQD